MIIKINGKTETIEKLATVGELVSKKALAPERIVVEHNLRILPREEWHKVILRDNDNIEIVSFVQGG